MRVGLISDTHNVLDEYVHEAFGGVDRIIHAGDIGTESVLWELEAIAPVTAVLGNCDSPYMLSDLAYEEELPIGGLRFRIVHDPREFGLSDAGIDVFVHGHTHVPRNESVGSRLIVNPGSASRPRGGSGRSVAVMEVSGGAVQSLEFIEF